MTRKKQTMDGNAAAAYVSYAFTEVAAIYPITPSSNMAENVDEWSANGMKNIFGQTVRVSELQSEAGAAGAVHGSLQGGALTTTYTASQGLLLMIPNMYKLAGELLPGVFHVSARAVAGHALSIFGDHSDVMATRQTGCAMLASGSVQEVMDLGGIAHLAAIKSSVPFVHFFDGFRTSHEMQKIEVIEFDEFDKLVDKEKIKEFRDKSLNPQTPVIRGTAQNPDVFFQAKEASNPYYTNLPDVVNDYMEKISEMTGREYKPFTYYGAEDAEKVIIAMGSVTETIDETVDYLMAKGEKVGVIKVHLYRPFSAKYFFNVFPSTAKKIAVMDRTKEPGALGEPLYQDIQSIFYNHEEKPMIIGGRYGLGSKDTTPSQIKAVFDNLDAEEPKNSFTIGIVDDVTNLSLEMKDQIVTAPKGTIRCKFWGLGSDGTVGANKEAIKIIGENTDKYAQAYFSYDSKKSGGVTISHLRFGDKPIRSTYLIDEADYIACHNQAYVNQYDLLKGLKKGGTFLLNCLWSKEELDSKLPASLKAYIKENDIQFYIINGTDIARDIGLGNRINMVMQAAFFKLAEVIDVNEAVDYLKKAIVKAYGSKGEKVVEMNQKAVDQGVNALVKIDQDTIENWNLDDHKEATSKGKPEFITNILEPMNAQEGDALPVSTFADKADGTFPMGTTEYEKRGIAVSVPEWKKENCIQCNQCAYVCPHAAIRPFIITEKERENAPQSMETLKAMGKEFAGYEYKIQVTPLDCTGCGNCVEVCPAPKGKALIMEAMEGQAAKEKDNFDYLMTLENRAKLTNTENLKGSQFKQPLFEFSGACAGCGETPYVKLITQLFGDRMVIANATGCSSIYGGSAPSVPYTTNEDGFGPAWANSLFEDNAEYGYGIHLANLQIRDKIQDLMEEANVSDELQASFDKWIENKLNAKGSKEATIEMLPLLEKEKSVPEVQEILDKKKYLVKNSQWIFGGDGWAYDIGYGGLDHVIASAEDVNILVMDTEVYSNTGGQSSKASPTASVAKFAASGKKTKKKDLGLMATNYGYVYVAQIAMGADKNQALKAIKEAEAYPGPSVIIAYSPCVAHGISTGMGTTQKQQKEAVDAGYWHLYRFNPELKKQGKNPFVLDSKEPTKSFRDFLMSEVRYSSLTKTFPEVADDLFKKSEEDAKERYQNYKRLAENQ